jgi:hypothetical protein
LDCGLQHGRLAHELRMNVVIATMRLSGDSGKWIVHVADGEKIMNAGILAVMRGIEMGVGGMI